MTRAHQVVVDVLQTPNLADMLTKLHDSDYRRELSGDALPEARKLGLRLPEKARSAVYVRDTIDGWEVEIQVLEGPQLIIFGFNSRHGFYMR